MSETRIETILYDADGNPTDDQSLAVRGEAVEVDADGNVIRRLIRDGLSAPGRKYVPDLPSENQAAQGRRERR